MVQALKTVIFTGALIDFLGTIGPLAAVMTRSATAKEDTRRNSCNLRRDDPAIAIDGLLEPAMISDRDAGYPDVVQ